MSSSPSTPGFNFDHSYAKLDPDLFYLQEPVPVKEPKLLLLNTALSEELGLNFSQTDTDQLAKWFSGNALPQGALSMPQAYAGHQFGHFTMLGDGRAMLMGEHITPQGRRVDLQFKGSGRTPYSRGGDGRATLYSMLREYLISEAMHNLGIPSSRSLAVVGTGEHVYRNALHPGAILTRVMSSHIRVGSFEFVRRFLKSETMPVYIQYVINRHYPELKDAANPALALLEAVMERQKSLIVEWMRVGFIHGVMNTDNTSICAETFDYGPCAFMNAYNPKTVFSSIDENGRYAFGNQPIIIQWNLAIFAGTLLSSISETKEEAIEQAQSLINTFPERFEKAWLEMMRKKLGITGEENSDEAFIQSLLDWMQENKVDYTNFFVYLMDDAFPDAEVFKQDFLMNWISEWKAKLSAQAGGMTAAQALMSKVNPRFIPRNHLVEEALEKAAWKNDWALFHELLEVWKNPYQKQKGKEPFMLPPPYGDVGYQTFCGT